MSNGRGIKNPSLGYNNLMAETESRTERAVKLDRLKRHVFHELLELTGRVFVVVKYSEEVLIGDRGFLPEEKENGLVLVLNKRMNFKWDDYGLDARLVFGTSPQHCIVPARHIIGVYSPELSSQFLCLTEDGPEDPPESVKDRPTAGEGASSKVVKVDFRRKRS